MPDVVVINALIPLGTKAIEIGAPGRMMGVPAVGGDLLVSIGTSAGDVPAAGIAEVAA
jgi:hypothetical protein